MTINLLMQNAEFSLEELSEEIKPLVEQMKSAVEYKVQKSTDKQPKVGEDE